MTDAEIAEMEAELRLHKEERLRLRALEMRLSRELAEAKALLKDAQPILLDGRPTEQPCDCAQCEPIDRMVQRINIFLAGTP